MRRLVPAPIRRWGRGVRRSASDLALLRRDELPADRLVELCFPVGRERVSPDLVARVAPSGGIRDLAQLRAVLGGVERQDAPSPVVVRFGPDDVVVRQFDGFRLALDRADGAISASLLTRDEWEPHITAVFRRLLQRGMTAIDIGANIGWFTMLASSLVGAGGRVIAIEPWSENCRLVIISARANGFDQVALHPVALAAETGWAHLSTHIGSNAGLVDTTDDGIASGRGVVVPTVRLDDVVPVDVPVDLVKIDVEGAEHRVLMGGQGTLERTRPFVVSELSVEMMRRVSGVDAHDYLAWFTHRGWRLHTVDRADGEWRAHPSPESLLATWPGLAHQEDLLLVPEERLSALG